MRRDRERLQDILDAIERIDRYAQRGRGAFEQDELVQVWIVHHLEIIGEASRTITEELRAAHPEIPWPQISAMRNILVHAYFGVDTNEVWDTVVRDLPVLRKNILAIQPTLKP